MTCSRLLLDQVFVEVDVALGEDLELAPAEGCLSEGALALLRQHRLEWHIQSSREGTASDMREITSARYPIGVCVASHEC